VAINPRRVSTLRLSTFQVKLFLKFVLLELIIINKKELLKIKIKLNEGYFMNDNIKYDKIS